MKLFHLLFFLPMLTFAETTPAADSPRPPRIPVRDFFKNPVSRGYQLSPDGQTLSWLQPWESRMNIHVRPVAGGEVRRLTGVKDRDIEDYLWKGNQTIIYLRDEDGDENDHVHSVQLSSGTTLDLTPFKDVKALLIDDLEDQSETDVLIGLNQRNPEIFDVHRLNVITGTLTLVQENPGNIQGWLTDHDGVLRVATTTDGVNVGILTRADAQSEFKEILTTSFREEVSPQFFTFDNRHLYVRSNLGRDKSVIVKIDSSTGREMETIYENPDYDVSGLGFSKKRKVLTEVSYADWKEQTHFLDETAKKLHARLEALLPGYQVEISAHDRAEEKFIVVAWNDRTLGARWLYDINTDKLEKLVEVAPWLKAAEMAPMQPISYQSRDGLTIHGYLTLPLGRPAKNLPLIVNPHGGPWVRDTWGFNPEVQLLANRGYAVLQVNYRGSTGYGRKFWEASFKQWGRAMQDDLTDGVQYLVGQGIADPKRIGIYGASYGGYAALAGITFTPDLYAAAVSYVGVSNLFTFMKTIPPYWRPFLEQMHAMVGDPEKDQELMAAASPALHVDRIKTPLFVAQGAQDPRVNKAESDQIVENLRKRGVEVEYLVKENEGHGFQNEENRFEFYEAMERFLAGHLHPD